MKLLNIQGSHSAAQSFELEFSEGICKHFIEIKLSTKQIAALIPMFSSSALAQQPVRVLGE